MHLCFELQTVSRLQDCLAKTESSSKNEKEKNAVLLMYQ